MNKPLEEMRKFVSKIPYLTLNQDQENLLAQYFVNEGFCKASDVAREIFEGIEKATEHYISKIKEMEKNLEGISEFYGGAITASNLMLNIIVFLKKKYTESEKE